MSIQRPVSAKTQARKRRELLIALGDVTLQRYKAKHGARLHPPDFNAAMSRICAKIVEEEQKPIV